MKRQAYDHLKLIYEELNNLQKEILNIQAKIDKLDFKLDIHETLNKITNKCSEVGESNEQQAQ
jgi:hypothetical protein